MKELPLFSDVFPPAEVARAIRGAARARWKRRACERLSLAAAGAWAIFGLASAASYVGAALGVAGVQAAVALAPLILAMGLSALVAAVMLEGMHSFWRVLGDERTPFFEHLEAALLGWNENLRWVNRAIVARNEGLLQRDLTPELAMLREREAHLRAVLRYAEHVATEGPMGSFTGRRPEGLLIEQQEALEALVAGSEEVFQRMIAYDELSEGAPRLLPQVRAGEGA